MSRSRSASRTMPWIALPLAILALLVVAVRRDRSGRVRPPAAGGRETLVAELPAETVSAAAARDDALADIREAEERLRRTRADLEGVRDEIEARRKDLERVRDDADAGARRSREELERARADLEEQRDSMEEAARDADRRLREAREGMEEMERQRRAQLEAAAGAGVARGLDAGLPPGLDPRAMVRGGLPPMPQGSPGPGAFAVPPSGRMTAAEVFFERRRINRLARAAEAGPSPTMEQVVRYAAAAAQPRLDATQLDRTTGDIAWPAPLTEARYAERTGDVERRFRARAAWGGSLGPEDDAALVAAIDALVEQLRENVSRYPGGTYGKARTFLDSLRDEADGHPYD